MNSSNISIDWSTDSQYGYVNSINIKQIRAEPIELGQLQNFSVALHDKSIEKEVLELASFFGNSRREVSLKDRKLIIIRSDYEKHIDDIFRVIQSLQDLLVLASGRIVYPYEIESVIFKKEKELRIPEEIRKAFFENSLQPNKIVKSNGFEIQTFDGDIKAVEEEVIKQKPIKICFPSYNFEAAGNNPDKQNILFTFYDVKENLPQILNSWEENSRRLDLFFDLYLRLIYIPKRHINELFLSLSQAIEGLHKVIKGKTKITKKGKECDIFFVERIGELWEESKPMLPEEVIKSSPENFLKMVRATRNYLTHLYEEEKDVPYIVRGQDLVQLCDQLKKILDAHILKQLGLEEPKIKSILSRF